MRSAPRARAASRKCLNLTSRLQSTSGLGVRPAAYSDRKCSKTSCQYSAEKSRKWIGSPSLPATATASRRSSSARQSPLPSSAQFCMNSPASGSPASRSSRAATDESTPPERPMMVRGVLIGIGMGPVAATGKPGKASRGVRQLVQHGQGKAAPGEEIGSGAPDQGTAVPGAGLLQFRRTQPQGTDDAVVEVAARVVADRLAGKGEAQVMAPGFGLPLVGAHERGELHGPACPLQGVAGGRVHQALVGLQAAPGPAGPAP